MNICFRNINELHWPGIKSILFRKLFCFCPLILKLKCPPCFEIDLKIFEKICQIFSYFHIFIFREQLRNAGLMKGTATKTTWPLNSILSLLKLLIETFAKVNINFAKCVTRSNRKCSTIEFLHSVKQCSIELALTWL